MGFAVTADPIVAFVDAVKAKLGADATFMAMVTGVYGQLPAAARTLYPYVVLGRRTSTPGGAMQLAGNQVSLQIDVWSDAKGPATVSLICSRIYAVLERQPLILSGFSLVEGSMTREFQEVFDEPDADSRDQVLYHGVQRWVADVHE